ncbi:FAD-binding protein [Arenimonas sp.]|uniref:L-aspartate oxidase n=1 Tax=Arenimonas sp. TaxID=1872635 RepID=UPI0025D04AB9|nr:FAD-binding protein [Arenimonas sp.]
MSATPPLVVVGSGVAGLSVALAAAPRPVWLLSRGHGPADTASVMAQGGIAAALGEGDDPGQHAADTLAAGAWHNHLPAVRALVRAAPEAVAWLAGLGVAFDHEAPGRLALGREGGHGRARIVHAGGDATGAAVTAALARAVAAAPHVRWLQRHELSGIGLAAGQVAAVRIRDPDGGARELATPDLVLATGGIGALFAATTNPPGADGGGLSLALAAGAELRDLEFIQCHPTALDVPVEGALPLVTEALRGAGARLVDERGDALMPGERLLGDLAPRDVVARRIHRHQLAGGSAWLDARGLDDAAWRQFPTVLALCAALGLDPRRQRLPVTPAVHFHMGGIAVDLDGASSVPGLHAAGEVACSGVHGANRLASNSLLEGVVFGRRLGERLRKATSGGVAAASWVDAGREAGRAARTRLARLAWRALGPLRDGETLAGAERAIESDRAVAATRQGKLLLAMLAAARARTDSLGAHHRVDKGKNPNIRHGIDTPAYGESA